MILTTEQKLKLENGMDLLIEGINHIGQPFKLRAKGYYSTDMYAQNGEDCILVIYDLPKNKLTTETQQMFVQIDLAYNQNTTFINVASGDNARLIATRISNITKDHILWEMSKAEKRETMAKAYDMRRKLIKELTSTNKVIVTKYDVIGDDVTRSSIENLGRPITYETRADSTLDLGYVDTIAPIFMTRSLSNGNVNLYGYAYMSILEPGVQRLTSIEVNKTTRCVAAYKNITNFTSADNQLMPRWRKDIIFKPLTKEEVSPQDSIYLGERETM